MLVINPKPSTYLKVWLIFIHLIASMSIFLLPFWIGLLSFLMIAISLYQSWFSQFIQPAIQTIILKNEQRCTLFSTKKAEFSATLSGSTVITNLFILFHFKDEQQHFYTKLVCVDSLSDKDWRALQVALKIQNITDN